MARAHRRRQDATKTNSGARPPRARTRHFQRFADALLAAPEKGAALLRELAGDREAYIAIHVTDLYKLGLMRPKQFDITYKNFPMEGNMHGLIGYLKNWMQSNHFDTYTLQSLSDKMVRAYFLREGPNSQSLIAQMLPFTESSPWTCTPSSSSTSKAATGSTRSPSPRRDAQRAPELPAGT